MASAEHRSDGMSGHAAGRGINQRAANHRIPNVDLTHVSLMGSAGINRQVAGDARALRERSKRLHPDPESCTGRREAAREA